MSALLMAATINNSSNHRKDSATSSSSTAHSFSDTNFMTLSSSSHHGNFSGAPTAPPPWHCSIEATAQKNDNALPRYPNRSAVLSSLPKKTSAGGKKENIGSSTIAKGKSSSRRTTGGMSRHSSFASSSSDTHGGGSQICIGDDRSDGSFYQLPLDDDNGSSSSFDDDDDDESSAYLFNTSSNYQSHQQRAGQPTSSVTAHNKSKRRRANSKKASNVRWVDSTQSFLSRDRFVKKYLSDSLLLSNSSFISNSGNGTSQRRVSFSSSTSSVSSSSFRLTHRREHEPPTSSLPASSCYVPVAKTPARAAALEHDILLSSSCSSSSLVADAALVDMARAAKRTLESVAKRQVLVGKWKQRTSATSSSRSYSQNSDSSGMTSDCQVYEYLTSSKDQYSVVAKVNLPCSLAEIQSVLAQSASRGTEFHRSMVMLFGDQYVYGLNVRSVDCSRSSLAFRRSSVAGSLSRRSSAKSMASSTNQQQPQQQPGTTRLVVNAVSLLMKRRLVWRPQNMSFLDYCDERPHSKSVTRVLQTLDADSDEEEEEDDEDPDDDESRHGDTHSQTRRRRRQRQSSALQLHESKRRRRGLRGLLAGYVLQEDSEEQFTRLFFYANHKSVSAAQSGVQQQRLYKQKPVKVTSWSVQLIREMVSKLCTLESVVLRRRLGFYPLMDVPVAQSSTATTYRNSGSSVSSCTSGSSDVALLQTPTGCCSSCYVPFNALLFRKKHFCHLCGLFTCRKCSKVEPIEKVLGLIDRRRVCVSCVSRVSHCAFNLNGAVMNESQQQQEQLKGKAMAKLLFSSDTGKKLANVPEEDFPLLLGDNEDDDDLTSTVLEDLALFPDEQLEHDNDLAAEKVATYLKKMFERSSSTRKNPFVSQQQHQQQGRLSTAHMGDHGMSRPRFFGEIGGAEKAGIDHQRGQQRESTATTTPKDSICLLDSSNLDGDESVDDG